MSNPKARSEPPKGIKEMRSNMQKIEKEITEDPKVWAARQAERIRRVNRAGRVIRTSRGFSCLFGKHFPLVWGLLCAAFLVLGITLLNLYDEPFLGLCFLAAGIGLTIGPAAVK